MRVRLIITFACLVLSAGCKEESPTEVMVSDGETTILLIPGTVGRTRSSDPDATLVSDINLFIFNDGLLEERKFLPSGKLEYNHEGVSCRCRMLIGGIYSIYACANLGYSLDITSLEDLLGYRYYMAYPDEFSSGMPMSGHLDDISICNDTQIRIPLTRMMSKVSLRLDRSMLDPGIRLYVRKAQIANCPTSALLFGSSKVMRERDVFINGFFKDSWQADSLNIEGADGKSSEVSLYMLENMQGDSLTTFSSYIELSTEYYSDSVNTLPGKYLRYRFYLGDSTTSHDVQRNCHYHITVTPRGTGISNDGWAVDKSALEE